MGSRRLGSDHNGVLPKSETASMVGWRVPSPPNLLCFSAVKGLTALPFRRRSYLGNTPIINKYCRWCWFWQSLCMARKLRVPYEGAIYHITCRWVGSWKDGDRELFRDDAARAGFGRGRVERCGAVGRGTISVRRLTSIELRSGIGLKPPIPKGSGRAL